MQIFGARRQNPVSTEEMARALLQNNRASESYGMAVRWKPGPSGLHRQGKKNMVKRFLINDFQVIWLYCQDRNY
jgi:hypothetical protein